MPCRPSADNCRREGTVLSSSSSDRSIIRPDSMVDRSLRSPRFLASYRSAGVPRYLSISPPPEHCRRTANQRSAQERTAARADPPQHLLVARRVFSPRRPGIQIMALLQSSAESEFGPNGLAGADSLLAKNKFAAMIPASFGYTRSVEVHATIAKIVVPPIVSVVAVAIFKSFF